MVVVVIIDVGASTTVMKKEQAEPQNRQTCADRLGWRNALDADAANVSAPLAHSCVARDCRMK